MDNAIEILLERYIRFPETLSPDERNEAQSLILHDKGVKKYVHWLQTFYKEYDVLKRPIVFELEYKSFELSGGGAFILSAMTESIQQQTLTTIATFYSSDETALIRVLKENESNTYQIHAISNFITVNDRLILGFKNTGLDMITEPGGKLRDIPAHYFNEIDWKSTRIVVRPPIGEYKSCGSVNSESLSLLEHSELLIKGSECTFSVDDERISRVLVEIGEKVELLILENGRATFNIDPNRDFQLYFYK